MRDFILNRYSLRVLNFICRSTQKRPYIWLLLILVVSIPAVVGIHNLGLDSNLIKLLPQKSPVVQSALSLRNKVGDGGYFTIIFESQDKKKLENAVRSTAEKIKGNDAVHIVDYQYPVDFYNHFRYGLIPAYYLERIEEYIITLKAKYSPFADDLLGDEDQNKPSDDMSFKIFMNQMDMISEYHQSEDGKLMGIFVKPYKGIADLKDTRKLFFALKQITRDASATYSIPVEIGASQQSLEEYDIIISDLKFAGFIAAVLILLVLLFSFRSFRIIPVVLFPLFIGLIWSFSLVPVVVGKLNVITAFLLIILFGMGVDYSIHLVKRFQAELARKSVLTALYDTFSSTGKSVIMSGLTTSLPLLALTFSQFKGFSEFGLIAGGSIIIIILSMILVMPCSLVIGYRLGLVKSRSVKEKKGRFISRTVLFFFLAVFAVSLISIPVNLSFDFDFNKFTIQNEKYNLFKEKEIQIYPVSMSPAAIYVIPDMNTLDTFLSVAKKRLKEENTTLSRIMSIRNFAPDRMEWQQRLDCIERIKDEVQGVWIEKVEDQKTKRVIKDFKKWTSPQVRPDLNEVPGILKSKLVASDKSGHYLVGIYPNISRRDGKQAMRATEELYGMDIPLKVEGPIGEMPVFAEILWLVSEEGPWIVVFCLFVVFLTVFVGTKKISESLWMVFPLITGVFITLGIMALSGIKLNFFNIVVIPSLLGMGVDHGIHFYRRWKELNGDTPKTQSELFDPLTACTITTMMGYLGMVFARHYGIQSIGITAVLGMFCLWMTSLFLFPVLLHRKSRKKG